MEDYKEKYEMALEKAKTLLSKCKRVSDKVSMIYRAEDIENMFPELKELDDEQIRKVLIELVKCNERSGYTLFNNISTSSMINWLEKQEQSKKTSIWKHWKNGICGNGEGKLVFLIKSGATYSLSSCLSFECDYIELSELENLMLEKQDKQNFNILWHNVSEEPEEQREIFCKWKGSDIDAVWHDVAFYHADTKTFWNGEHQIEDVIKWTYIDDMIEEQPQLYLKPKFEVGDWVAINPELRFASPLYIKDIDKSNYRVESLDGNSGTPTIDYLDNHYHLWTIEDAKDGDVLFLDLMGGETFIYNGINPNMAILYSFIINNNGEDVLPYHIGKPNVGIGNIEETKNIIRPATKEQRNLLFTKMKEAGYEWDAEKKELKNLKEESENCKQQIMSEMTDLVKDYIQQKSAWTEEDEKKRTLLIKILEVNHPYGIFKINSSETIRTEELVSWLKSLNS